MSVNGADIWVTQNAAEHFNEFGATSQYSQELVNLGIQFQLTNLQAALSGISSSLSNLYGLPLSWNGWMLVIEPPSEVNGFWPSLTHVQWWP
jgi:hypothetical protein